MNDCIGQATMLEDGTLVLDLYPRGEQGEIGIAQLRYGPEHAAYAEILEHLGGLEPGQQKLVRPWD